MAAADQAKSLLVRITDHVRRYLVPTPSPSGWRYESGGSEALSAGLFKLVSGSGMDGVAIFSRNDEKVTLRYKAGGVGVGIGGPPVAATLSPMSAPNTQNRLYLMPGSTDYATSHDLSASVPIVMLCGEAGVFFEGTACLMLLGIHPSLVARLRKLAEYTRQLQLIARQRPRGFAGAVALNVESNWDVAMIEVELAVILADVAFRGMMGLVRAGVFVAGMEAGFSSGAGLTAYFGEAHGIGESAIPDRLKGPAPQPEEEPLPPVVEKEMYYNSGGIEWEKWP